MPKKRNYLSFSQLNLWERNPDQYYRQYILGEDGQDNKYLKLGRQMATALEFGFDAWHDKMIEMMLVFMPSYPKKEFKITAKLDGIKLLGVLDGFNPRKLIIGEYKTSKNNFTQKMVDTSTQITFYSLLVWLKYKKLPNKIFLHWARTIENSHGELGLTGDFQTFETKRTLKDIIMLSRRIKRAWNCISNLKKLKK